MPVDLPLVHFFWIYDGRIACDYFCVVGEPDDCKGRDYPVWFTEEPAYNRPGLVGVCGLSYNLPVAIGYGIGADDQIVRFFFGHIERLGEGQAPGIVVGGEPAFIECGLVDI